jgi:hypothetical protein
VVVKGPQTIGALRLANGLPVGCETATDRRRLVLGYDEGGCELSLNGHLWRQRFVLLVAGHR